MANPFRVTSAEDLEVALLFEAHGLLANVISPCLYDVSGSPPDQVSTFANPAAFTRSVIRVGEFLSEAARNVSVRGGAFSSHPDGYEQYFSMADEIVALDEFCGADFSYGDQYISIVTTEKGRLEARPLGSRRA